MNVKIEYKKTHVTFEYLGKKYSGEIICNDAKTYWLVFDQIDVKPFGGSIAFKIVNGQLEPLRLYPSYETFIALISTAIDNYRKELCN